MILVIMLNFLISVIGDTYKKVTDRSKMHTYRYKNQLNLEYLSIRDRFRTPLKIDCLILVTADDAYKCDDETPEINEKIVETKEQIQQMDNRLQKVESNVDDIKKNVDDIKKMLITLTAKKE